MVGEEYKPLVPGEYFHEQQDNLHLIIHPRFPRWVVLNHTGLVVLRLCDGLHSVSEIIQKFAEQWGKEPSEIKQDVIAVLNSLDRSGFLSEPLQSNLPSRTSNPSRKGWNFAINVTDQCNLHCLHCGVMAGPTLNRVLPTARLSALIQEALDHGATSIGISGGEPLLHDGLLDVIAFAAERVKVTLATNGLLIGPETAARLARSNAIIQVSLDGYDQPSHDQVRGQGAFERAWRGIGNLQANGIGDRLSINATLMRHTVDHIDDFIRLASERDVPGIHFTMLQKVGRAAEGWSELVPTLDQYKAAFRHLFLDLIETPVSVSRGFQGLVFDPSEARPWCGLDRNLVLAVDGNLYPCGALWDSEFRLGNVDTSSLEAARQSEKLQNLIEEVNRRKDEIDKCRACPWRNFCQANCAGSVWLQYGSWNTTDALCELRDELYRKLIFRQAVVQSKRPYPGSEVSSESTSSLCI